eukprot:7344296-Ditylum_brightwellii.AAC.1
MKGLTKLKHPCPRKPEYSLHWHIKITYGPKGQLVSEKDTSPKVPKETIKYIQTALGIFLWYGQIIDLMLLPALNAISAQQVEPTVQMVKELDHFLNFMWTYPNTVVHFHTSNMSLHIHSNAAYMVLPEAHSRVRGYFYLSSTLTPTNNVPLNSAIHNECSSIRNVMGSAAEAAVRGLYINCQRGEEIQTALMEMGHPQLHTIVITDDSTANKIVNDCIKQCRSCAIDMCVSLDKKTGYDKTIIW